jgi:hypothetical protein
MSETIPLPPTDEIRNRMVSCREELMALKRLLRLAEAAERAEQARQSRQQPPGTEDSSRA